MAKNFEPDAVWTDEKHEQAASLHAAYGISPCHLAVNSSIVFLKTNEKSATCDTHLLCVLQAVMRQSATYNESVDLLEFSFKVEAC